MSELAPQLPSEIAPPELTPTPEPAIDPVPGNDVAGVQDEYLCCRLEPIEGGSCTTDTAQIRVHGAGDAPITINGHPTLPQLWTDEHRGTRLYVLTGLTPEAPNPFVLETRSRVGSPIRCEHWVQAGQSYRLTLRGAVATTPIHDVAAASATDERPGVAAIDAMNEAKSKLDASTGTLLSTMRTISAAGTGLTEKADQIGQSAGLMANQSIRINRSANQIREAVDLIAAMIPQTAERVYELRAGGDLKGKLKYDDENNLVLSGIVFDGGFFPQTIKFHDKNEWMIKEVAGTGSLELNLGIKLKGNAEAGFPGAKAHTVDVPLTGEFGSRVGEVRLREKDGEASIEAWLSETLKNVKDVPDDKKIFERDVVESLIVTGKFTLGGAEPKDLDRPVKIEILPRG